MGKRRRVTLEKIQNQTHRLVTFSKRRKGLLQKSAELCLMCNAQVALVVFSSSGKAFAFGHPSVESIFHHYLNGTFPINGGVRNEHHTEARRIENLKQCLKNVEKKKSDGKEKISNFKEWIEKKCAECQSVEEMQSLKNLLIGVKEKVGKIIDKLPTTSTDLDVVSYQNSVWFDDVINIPLMPDFINDSKVLDVPKIDPSSIAMDDEFFRNFDFDQNDLMDYWDNGLEGVLPPIIFPSAATNFGEFHHQNQNVEEAGPSTMNVFQYIIDAEKDWRF